MLHPDHAAIVAEARKWLGVRWHHQGRTTAGIDCIGLAIKVGEAVGLVFDDMTGYRRVPDGIHFLNTIREQSVRELEPRPGTVAIFRESAYPCHAGIFAERAGKLSIIHAYAVAGKVVEEFYTKAWAKRLIEVRGYKGVIDAPQDDNENG